MKTATLRTTFQTTKIVTWSSVFLTLKIVCIAKTRGAQKIASNARTHFNRKNATTAQIVFAATTFKAVSPLKIAATVAFWRFAVLVKIALAAPIFATVNTAFSINKKAKKIMKRS